MRMWYAIAAVAVVGLLIFLGMRSKPSPSNPPSTEFAADTSKTSGQQQKENPYSGMRAMALRVSADDLKLSSQENQPYGVIVDWDMGDAVVTTVAFQTGDASIYISSGQAFIGGYGHPTVVNAAKALVSGSVTLVSNAQLSSDISLPTKSHVKFHLLTTSGHFVHEEPMTGIESGASVWRPLFDLCQEVITEYRLVTEKK